MKAGSMQTIGTFTQYPSQIWGPDTVKVMPELPPSRCSAQERRVVCCGTA